MRQTPPFFSGLCPPSGVFALLLLITACQSPIPQQDYQLFLQKGSNSNAEASEAENLTLPIAQNFDASDDASIYKLYEFGRELVEKRFSIDLKDVTLDIVDNDELEKIVRRETKRLTMAVFPDPEFAEFFLNRIMQDQAGSYAGLYVSQENAILVNRALMQIFMQSLETQPRRIQAESLLALLIHELVHAADNSQHNIHANRELNFRASVAQSAVFEGHAQLATRQICAQVGCLTGLKNLDTFMFEAPEPSDPVARSLQAISRNVLEYSYVEGERFLHQLSRRSDGDKRLQNVLRQPPKDPVQILAPETYPNLPRVERNLSIVELMQSVDHRWNQSKFAMIETSPIKGLDMRDNPARRKATKEGFTKLIQSMVGLQVFDQSTRSVLPVEITVMQTDTKTTAELFARSFFEKNRDAEEANSQSNTLEVNLGKKDTDRNLPMRIYVTFTDVDENNGDSEAGDTYLHLIAHSENWIIQIGGFSDPSDSSLLEFSELAMLDLLDSNIK